MNDRETILSALPADAGGESPAIYDRLHPALHDAWFEFEEKLGSLGGQMLPIGALPLLFERGACWVDEDARGLIPPSWKEAASIWEAEIGICLADCVIAETGTVLLSAGSGRRRMASLAPPVNVVLVREADIVPTPEDAFQRISSATSVLITGTSRTGDIEGVLVRGVHGPREVYVVRI